MQKEEIGKSSMYLLRLIRDEWNMVSYEASRSA